MYGKIFSSLWEGSLIGRSDEQLVFVFLISNCDSEGFADYHPQMISALTGLSPERVGSAISHLESPDPESRTPDLEGRRLQRMDEHRTWGWRVVNYKAFRDRVSAAIVKEQNRVRQQKRRDESRTVTHASRTVTHRHAESRQVEVEVEVEAVEEKDTPFPPSGGVVADFELLWKAYPHYGRRSSKARSLARWRTTKAPREIGAVLASLALSKRSDDWVRESGRFVPALEVWIGKRGWESSNGVGPPASAWDVADAEHETQRRLIERTREKEIERAARS